MSNLFSALQTAGNSLRVFDSAISTTQNNVTNASAPGYVKQTLDITSLPFDVNNGSSGGIASAGLSNSRNQYAEREVRRQNESLGSFTEQSNSLSAISSLFDVTGNSGIPKALSDFFQNVSAWGVDPSSQSARQSVLDAAGNLAASFQQTKTGLDNAANDIDNQLDSVTTQVNSIAADLAALNNQRSTSTTQDPSVEAKIYSDLEQLSGLVSFTVLYPADETVTVLVGGQKPLVLGSNHYDISATASVPTVPTPTYPSAPTSAQIQDSNGVDITSLISGGQLGGLLSVRNGLLSSLRGDSQQQGDLNNLAKQIADRVNGILTAGNITDGPPPQSGVPLFSYSANPTSVGGSLSVTNITTGQLAAIQPGPPEVSNGVILQLAGLATSSNPADQVNGATYSEYYGVLAGRVGQQQNTADDGVTQQTQSLALARNQRQQLSGVSLDEEATRLIELQRSYQAAAQMVSVINGLTEMLINMIAV